MGLDPTKWEAIQFDEAVLALSDRIDNAVTEAVDGAKDQRTAHTAAVRAVERIITPPQPPVDAANGRRKPLPVEYEFTPDGEITVRQKPV